MVIFMINNYLAPWPDFDYQNFRYLLDDVSQKYSDNTAIHMPAAAGRSRFLHQSAGSDGKYLKWTYETLAREVKHLASFIIHFGLHQDDRVALLSENRTEWMEVYLATVIGARIIVPIDANITADEVHMILSESGARLLFTSEKLLPKAREAIERGRTTVEEVVCFDDLPEGDQSIAFASIMEEQWDAELPGPDEIPGNQDAAIIYTSGTTGVAKGVILTHKGIIANANASILSLPIDETDVFVAVLPFHHTYPTTCSFISPLMVGGGVSIVDRIVGQVIIEVTRETGGTILIGVPLLFDKIRQGIEKKLSELPPMKRTLVGGMKTISRAGNRLFKANPGKSLFKSLREKAGLRTLRLLVAGGGPLSQKTADFFQNLGFEMRQGYGMSENGPLIAANTMNYFDNRSVGLPVKYTEVRISEPDEHGVGEIQVKSPSLMKGYFNNPEATKEVMTDDGYLRTGDMGYIDKRGFIYITGRSKNLIVTSGGKNVYPEEIEHYFAESPVVGEVLVLGTGSHGEQDERVAAAVYPDYERLEEEHGKENLSDNFVRDLVQEEIKNVNGKLPGYKKIDEWIIRKEEFEKTSSKKIKRFIYKDLDACRTE